MMPMLIRFLDNYISHYLRFGYGVGKGFVLGEEDVLEQFNHLQFIVNENIGRVMKSRVEKSRLDVLRSLCEYIHFIFYSCCFCCPYCYFVTVYFVCTCKCACVTGSEKKG